MYFFPKLLDMWKQMFKMKIVRLIAMGYFRNQSQKWIKIQIFFRRTILQLINNIIA